MSERFINRFTGGMVQDVDIHYQDPSTYRYSLNGRVLYNSKEGSTLSNLIQDGSSMAWVNEKGNTFAFAICEGFEAVGKVRTRDGILILSTNGTESHIGIAKQGGDSGNYFYDILFSDRSDPNGEKLNFRKPSEVKREVDIVYVYENENSETIYFADGYNEERALRLNSLYQGFSCDSSCGDSSTTPFHNDNGSCGEPLNAYPPFLSVHGMASRMDLVFPKIKFQRRIDGTLKRGVYQYAVRYTHPAGHKSVWSYITRHIVVTGTSYPTHPEYLGPTSTFPSGYSHHNREMSVTGNDSITEDGIRLEINNIDTRWTGIEVAYVYSKTDAVSHEANVFFTINGNCGRDRLPSSLIVDHVNHTGVPVGFDEFNQRYETILSVDTLIDRENLLFRGGVELLPEIKIDTSSATVAVKSRYFNPDETIEPVFQPRANPKTRKEDGDPLTNTRITTKTVSISTFGAFTEQYGIYQDYESYKGQQFEHLFTQYMGGETYGFAAVAWDRKGNPLFATHIDDFTFPEQYETVDGEDFTLSRRNGANYDLRIKGLTISNLKIPKACLYDKFGRLNISGFSIVRTDRVGEVMHQGIVVPVVENTINDGGDKKTQQMIKPHPFLSNKFDKPYMGDLYGTNHEFIDTINGRKFYMVREEASTRYDAVDSMAGYCMYFSPDVMVEETFEFLDIDRIKHVGTCHRAYTKDLIALWGSRGNARTINGTGTNEINDHYYAKCYNTDLSRANGDPELSGKYGRSRVGEESRLKFAELIPAHDTVLEKFDKDDTILKFKNGDIWTLVPNPNGSFTGSYAWKRGNASGVRNSLLLGMMDFEHIDIWDNQSSASYRIVNYLRPKNTYITPDETSGFDARQYQSTGHYQPITPQILSLADQDADNYIFNNVEVWGGDTFVNLFDFTRVVPEGIRDCDNTNRMARTDGASGIKYDNDKLTYKEHASSMIIPLESKYNLALRFGRHFAKNATYPQNTYCENVDMHFNNGIMTLQPESFSINRVLLHQENIQFFSVKPPGQKIINRKDNSIYYSDNKTYSEEEDSYRKQRVLNYIDIHGANGKITGMVKSFNYIYLIQERAYGILRTSERAIVPTTTGEVLLGTGSELSGIDYISTDYGSQHPQSIFQTQNSIYFWDVNNAMIVRHSQAGRDEMSDTKGLHDFTKFKSLELKQGGNVIGYYDKENDDIGFSLVSNEEVLSLKYNTELTKFHGYYSYAPDLCLYDDLNLISANRVKKNEFYFHNKGKYGQFYGVYYPSVLRFIVNPNFNYNKYFDNMFVNVNKGGQIRIGKVKITTEDQVQELTYQENGVVTDKRFDFRQSQLRFPLREKAIGVPRNTGDVMTIEITVDNENQEVDNQNKQVVILAAETTYRMKNRL